MHMRYGVPCPHATSPSAKVCGASFFIQIFSWKRRRLAHSDAALSVLSCCEPCGFSS